MHKGNPPPKKKPNKRRISPKSSYPNEQGQEKSAGNSKGRERQAGIIPGAAIWAKHSHNFPCGEDFSLDFSSAELGPFPAIFHPQHFSDHKLAILALGSLRAVSLFPLCRFFHILQRGKIQARRGSFKRSIRVPLLPYGSSAATPPEPLPSKSSHPNPAWKSQNF